MRISFGHSTNRWIRLAIGFANSSKFTCRCSHDQRSWNLSKIFSSSSTVNATFSFTVNERRQRHEKKTKALRFVYSRMYFCSSLNVDLLCYLSVHYRMTLECLDVMDSVTEPALRYHNLFRAEPDPLVLLAWQCKKLTSLTILGKLLLDFLWWSSFDQYFRLGYEVLEVNLLAIARLRPQLRTLNVCADCVMTLQYGHLQMNHQFIEDDDGNDAFIQYGICTNSIQTMVFSFHFSFTDDNHCWWWFLFLFNSIRLDKFWAGHGIHWINMNYPSVSMNIQFHLSSHLSNRFKKFSKKQSELVS